MGTVWVHLETGKGTLLPLLMPGSSLWPEYINWRCNFVVVVLPVGGTSFPPPAASLDLCPAVLVV